jgi:hypothetical protein
LRALERRLQAAPDVPLVVLRSSRRATTFEICARLAPASRRVLLWKGSPAFLDRLDERVRSAYEAVRVPGDGFFSVADARLPELARLRGAVVILDIPGGAVETYQNVIDFARALAPSRILAFHGADCEMVPLEPFEPLVGRRTALPGKVVPRPAREPLPVEVVRSRRSVTRRQIDAA